MSTLLVIARVCAHNNNKSCEQCSDLYMFLFTDLYSSVRCAMIEKCILVNIHAEHIQYIIIIIILKPSSKCFYKLTCRKQAGASFIIINSTSAYAIVYVLLSTTKFLWDCGKFQFEFFHETKIAHEKMKSTLNQLEFENK